MTNTNQNHICSVDGCQGPARFNLAASLAYPSLYVCSACWHEMVANGEGFEAHQRRRRAALVKARMAARVRRWSLDLA